MARTKEKKKEIVLTKDNLLIQPLALTLLGVVPSVIGNRASIAIVRRLQEAFKEIITNRKSGKEWQQLSIFDTGDVKDKYLGTNKLIFDIHMNELVSDPKHYQDAFNTACKLGDTIVWVPMPDKDGNITMVREHLFTLLLKGNVEEIKREKKPKKGQENSPNQKKEVETIYRYKKNTKPVIGIAIEQAVADYIFSFQKLYGDFLDYTAIEANDKYFAPIYIFLSAHKYSKNGCVEVDYSEFRRFLGFDDSDPEQMSYKVFADFNKKIIQPCMKDMAEKSKSGECDFYFEFEKIYLESKRAKNPDKLKFTIILSDLGKAIKEDRMSTKQLMGLEKRLRDEFDQNEKQVRALMKKVPFNAREIFVAKMDDLLQKKKDGKIEVKESWQSYANVSFTDFIATLEKKHADILLPFQQSERENMDSPVQPQEATVQPEEVLSEEDQQKWNKFMELVKAEVPNSSYETWFLPIVPLRLINNELHVKVPSAFFYEFLESNFIDVMKKSLYDSFSPGIKLLYKLGS